MYALFSVTWTHIHCGNYAAANALADELVAVADQKGALFWKAFGMLHQGRVLALTGQASDAVHMLGSAITALRSTGATLWMPSQLSYLARAYANSANSMTLGAVLAKPRLRWKQQRKTLFEAEVHRTAVTLSIRRATQQCMRPIRSTSSVSCGEKHLSSSKAAKLDCGQATWSSNAGPTTPGTQLVVQPYSWPF